MDSFQQAAREILAHSEGGAQLHINDARLARLVLTGEEAFDAESLFRLRDEVISREYFAREYWLHGVKYLSDDAQGFVYWKGNAVEHFTHPDAVDGLRAAQSLALRCRLLEKKGFPVTGRNVAKRSVLEAPRDTPWLPALQRFHSFFKTEDGSVEGIFYCDAADGNQPDALSIGRGETGVAVKYLGWVYEAFQRLRGHGLKLMPSHPTYDEFVSQMARWGLTPAQLQDILRLRSVASLQELRA